MRTEGFVTIAEWMLDLDLNTTEMLAFALICGINMHAHSDYHGSIAHLARWCRVSERQTRSILRKLVETGYLNVEKYPGKTDHYTVREEIISGVKKLPGREEIISGVGAEKSSYDNIVSDKIEDNIKRESVLRAREDDGKKAYGTKVRMTPDEYAKIVSRYGSEDAAAMVQMLDDYLVDHPRKHYANHYRAAIGWPAQRLMEQRTAEQRLKNAQEAAQRVSAQQAPVTHYADIAEIDARRKAIEDKYSAIYNAKKNN